MKEQSNLNVPEEIRLYNIVDMGLTFSAMIRLFEKGSKKKLHRKLLTELRNIFETESKERFISIHSNFCHWGTKNIQLAEKKRKGQIIKKSSPASYGQIAKTLDVVLKVAVYYSHLPSCEKSQEISEWLNAAVDTKMMAMLKKHYPEDIKPWPTSIEQTNKTTYTQIQEIVRKFIKEKHNNHIMPVQFDDIYWRELNR